MFLLLRFGYIGFHFVKWLNWLELYIYIYHILLVAYIILNVALEFLLDG